MIKTPSLTVNVTVRTPEVFLSADDLTAMAEKLRANDLQHGDYDTPEDVPSLELYRVAVATWLNDHLDAVKESVEEYVYSGQQWAISGFEECLAVARVKADHAAYQARGGTLSLYHWAQLAKDWWRVCWNGRPATTEKTESLRAIARQLLIDENSTPPHVPHGY